MYYKLTKIYNIIVHNIFDLEMYSYLSFNIMCAPIILYNFLDESKIKKCLS